MAIQGYKGVSDRGTLARSGNARSLGVGKGGLQELGDQPGGPGGAAAADGRWAWEWVGVGGMYCVTMGVVA